MSLISTLLLLGALQGAIMGVALLVKFWSVRPRADQFYLALALLVLTVSLVRLSVLPSSTQHSGWLFALPLATDLLILPLFWQFALRVMNRPSCELGLAWIWCLPWVIFFTYSLVFYLSALFEPSMQAKQQLALSWHYDAVRRFEDYLTAPFNVLLGGILCWSLMRYLHRIQNWVPNSLHRRVQVTRWFLGLALLGLVALSAQFINRYFFTGADSSVLNVAAQIAFVVIIYLLGFLGFQFSALPKFDLSKDADSATAFNSADQARLETLMAQGLYLNADLNLNDVARRLGMSANRASSLIKQVSGQNFRRWINTHRIEAVKEALKDDDRADQSVLSLALESGFKSEASFYRAFKELTGMSPSDYRKSQ